jgi:hypothetical protein
LAKRLKTDYKKPPGGMWYMFRKIFVSLFVLGIFLFPFDLGWAQGYAPEIGETLQYKLIVKSMIHGANQTVKVVSREKYNGNEVYRIQSSMTTVGVVQKLYSYSETEEILLSADGLYPVYLKRKIHEKDETEIDEVRFDYTKGIAFRSLSKNGAKPEYSEIKLPGYVCEGLSLQYFLRRIPSGSKNNKLYFYSKGKIKEVAYRISEEHQKALTLDCGTFSDYYRIEGEDILVVIADNSAHFPLVIRKMANFGKVEARLINISE